MNDFIITPMALVPRGQVTRVDLERVEQGVIVVHYDGRAEEVTGVMAFDILMALRPSALEGLRGIRWPKRAWVLHNLVAHPAMQLLALARCYRLALWVHDATVPRPSGLKAR